MRRVKIRLDYRLLIFIKISEYEIQYLILYFFISLDGVIYERIIFYII